MAIVVLLFSFRPVLSQDWSNHFEVTGAQVSIQFMGKARPYVLLDLEGKSVLYRRLLGSQDKYSFSQFKASSDGAPALTKIFRNLVLSDEPEIRGESIHGPILIVQVRMKTPKGASFTGSFTKCYGYDGVPYEFFTDSWKEAVASEPEIDAETTERLGVHLRKAADATLRYSPKESVTWVGSKCQVVIPDIRPGSNGHETWKYPIAFPENISPTQLSFETDWNSILRTEPDGVVDLGGHYGYYQVVPVISHPKQK